jgi:hypothetical protein
MFEIRERFNFKSALERARTPDTDNVLLVATTAMAAVGVDVALVAESRGYDAQNDASSPTRRNGQEHALRCRAPQT